LHVHIESSIGLCLAVGNAKSLAISLSHSELIVVDTVFVALGEQQVRESVAHQRLLLVDWILCPV